MENVRNIAKNTLMVLVARGINSIFGFSTTIMLARYLGIEEYGKFAYIYTLLSFTVLIADLGGFQVITRELSREQGTAKNIISSALMLRIFVSAFLLIFIGVLTHFTQRDFTIKIAIYIVTIPQLIFALNTIFVAVFTANNRFGFDSLMQITSRGIEFLAIILVVYFELGFIALFAGIGISYLINGFLGLFMYLKNYNLPLFHYDLKYCKYLLYESLPIAMTTILSIAILRVDIFVLKLLKDTTDIAFFNVPYVFIYTLIIIPQSFVSVIFPILCKLGSSEEKSKFAFSYGKAFKCLYITSIPISMILICLSGPILNFTYGAKFLASTNALKIMGLSIIFLFLNSLNTFTLISIKKQHLSTISTAVAFLVNLVFDLVLIPKYGFLGASIATTLCYGMYFVLTFYFVCQSLGCLNLIYTFIKPALCAGAMALFIAFFHNTNLFIILPAGIIIYISSLIIVRVFPIEDIELAKRLLFPYRTRHSES
jgi:O-antigen/teichoic acid export membrane protein